MNVVDEVKRPRGQDDGPQRDDNVKRTKPNAAVDSTELASAVALASLASFSPSTEKPVTKPHYASQHPQQSDRALAMTISMSSSTLGESRPPHSDCIPITPDIRSPMGRVKRVHFASGAPINNPAVAGPPQEHFDYHAARAPPMHAFPPQFRPPHPVGVPHGQSPWMFARMPPNRMMGQQPFNDQHWICDFCNAVAFNTYEEACVHEEACKMQCRPHGADGPRFPLGQTSSMATSGKEKAQGEMGSDIPTRAASNAEWFSGSVSLCIPESDAEWLSEINCFLRKYCVEAFSATEEDVLSTSKRGRITIDQVGIRCVHCKHKPLKERAVAAVSYPTSVAGIYESVKRFHRIHVEHCECIPGQVRSKMAELNNQNVWIPTTRQYWTDSARAIGMVDTDEGIRFSCDPQFIRSANPPPPELMETVSASAQAPGGSHDDHRLQDGDHIVFPEDTLIVPAYVYFLMRQVESCHFSEVDRFVARSKGPVGYPGFQCRHCSGHAGLGKYFPVSAKTLSTNSTSQNIHAHLLKCRKCPDHVKEKLVSLKAEKSRSPRLEPGWRKLFFDKVWQRLHG